MADHFPDGVTLKKMEGTLITVESQHFRLIRLISEKFITALQARTAVFEGQRLRDGVTAVLKLRFQYIYFFLGLPILCPLLTLSLKDGSILDLP
jgi:hypothetical protein